MRLPSFLLWPLLFLGQLLSLSLLTWHLLAQFSFGYPLGYRLLDLRSHIAQYAPYNHYKQGFELTNSHEHWKLFREITNAVQHNGEGLADIQYRLPNGQLTPLMHADEIAHLEDVSHLIREFYHWGYLGTMLWLGTLWLAYRQHLPFPPLNRIALGASGALTLILATLFAAGPTRVFYWIHTKIFPSNHKWFFYYKDSLMTTMMKAPDIFAFIGIELLLMLLLLLTASIYAMAHSLAHNAALSNKYTS